MGICIILAYHIELSYSDLLLDAAVGGTDDIDTRDRDVGADGFACLDGVVGNDATTHAIDAHIGVRLEGGGDTEGALVNGERKVAITKVVV